MNTRSYMNPKHKKYEENYTEPHHNKIFKTSDKEKTLKAAAVKEGGANGRMTGDMPPDIRTPEDNTAHLKS